MNIDISDIDGLRQRLDEIDERFNRLVNTLRAVFGDEASINYEFTLAQNADLKRNLESAHTWRREQDDLIVEVARALGVNHGGITKEKILKAAKKRKAESK